MKILVAGIGKVGLALTKMLVNEGHDITLIDTDPAVLKAAMERYDVMTAEGNCASVETLKTADVDEADLIIATTHADELNLLSCMTAHAINENIHTISRVRNPDYSEGLFLMRKKFGVSMTVNPERLASEEIYRLVAFPGFLSRETFAKGRVQLTELKIDENSRLDGVRLSELDQVIKTKVIVCCVLRGDNCFIPGGDFVLTRGDRIYVTGNMENLGKMLTSLGEKVHRIKNKSRKIFICGGGSVSYYLTEKLSKRKELSIKIMELDRDRCIELSNELPNVLIVNKDASVMSALDSEWIGDTDCFISLTGIDELNILNSMYAQKLGVPQVITKVGRGKENFKILDDLPVGSIICPKELCCNNIVRYVRALDHSEGAAKTIHFIADAKASAIEFEADDLTAPLGVPLKDCNIKKGVLIACITRNGAIVFPNGDTTIEPKDTVIVIALGASMVRNLNDIFEGYSQ